MNKIWIERARRSGKTFTAAMDAIDLFAQSLAAPEPYADFTTVRGIFRPKRTDTLKPDCFAAIGREGIFMVFGEYESGPCIGKQMMQVQHEAGTWPFAHCPACDVEVIEVLEESLRQSLYAEGSATLQVLYQPPSVDGYRAMAEITVAVFNETKCKIHGGTGFSDECWLCNATNPEPPMII